ncbi:histidine phosphatase family protein [Xanthobacter sp. TB0139]|uniref:histidine phosphatase family protein n=1 Tax=Xanthobacter sp. TB0139 TaxID=3459178 RepID=UPI00403A4AFC
MSDGAETRRLFFVRHGETDWNVAGRLQGRRDVPLNALGRVQAGRIGRLLPRLTGEAPERLQFVSSPMARTLETMRIMRTTLDLPVNEFATDIRLAELSFGDWEGKTWPQLRRSEFEGVRRRDEDPWNYAPPNGESYQALSERLARAISDIEGDAVVVTHGGVIRTALHVMAGMPIAEATGLPVRQGAVYVVQGGSFQVAS